MIRRFFRLLPLVACLSPVATYAQLPIPKFTPPGKVLLAACEQINSSDRTTEAMFQREYCFRFIESALMMDRYQQKLQNERLKKWTAKQGPLTSLTTSFCYPHSTEWGVSGMHVAGVAKELVSYLRTQNTERLDRLTTSDDTQMRLLFEMLETQYPCTSKAP